MNIHEERSDGGDGHGATPGSSMAEVQEQRRQSRRKQVCVVRHRYFYVEYACLCRYGCSI